MFGPVWDPAGNWLAPNPGEQQRKRDLLKEKHTAIAGRVHSRTGADLRKAKKLVGDVLMAKLSMGRWHEPYGIANAKSWIMPLRMLV